MPKLIGIFSLLLGLAIGGHVAFSYYMYANSSPPSRLQMLWNRDVELLRQTGKLPKDWQKISEVVYVAPTPLAKKWIREIEVPVQLNKSGHYVLEVLVTDWADEGRLGAVVQYDLIDKKTGNVKWEFGRTFVLGSTELADSKLLQKPDIIEEPSQE